MQNLNSDSLLQIANEIGTPVYVYHIERITKQYQKLTDAFTSHPTRFFYACKALTNINILKHLLKLNASLDCVSINEVMLGLKAGFKKQNILFTPNCVDFAEIVQAKELGVNINIDNISILEQFGNQFGSTYPVCIRINPHIEAGGNYKISTGHIDSKFGISIHQLRHIERIVKTTGLNVHGLHMHTGSEIKDIDTFLQGFDILLDVSLHFERLKFIDLGSGFKVPYQKDEKGTDVIALGKKLNDAIAQFEKENKKSIEIWFEPGKFLVSECGYFLVKANIIKQTTATVFVGVNSGFNHLIRPMFYDAYHHISNLSNPEGPERIYTVVGNICETDTFAWDRVLNEVRESDILCFHNAGAYAFEMSSNYNSRFKPAEVMMHEGKYTLIRERDTFDDLMRKQIEVI